LFEAPWHADKLRKLNSVPMLMAAFGAKCRRIVSRADGTVRLWVPVWTVSTRLVYRCFHNHKKLAAPANIVQWEARRTCER
jgi:hypothetical protein